ncbi:MAG: Holliday junction resolvase RuvX [Rhodospirillales bacterium]|nr:MAG: Holliday junction resolvase RuvX [Rhodospirillales bacterium]
MAIVDLDALSAILPAEGRLMGLDVGTKTIGLATSDIRRQFTSPLETIARVKFGKDAAALAAIVAREGVAALVIGLPLNMDGTEGPRCQSVRQFAANLASMPLDTGGGRRFADLPMVFQDERLSTAGVERTMIDAYDMSRRRRDSRIDAGAAAWILQAALDRLRHLSAVDEPPPWERPR